jgi:hypothetical protein
MGYVATSRTIVRHEDPRYVVDLPAKVVLQETTPLPARLVNLSRHGFRVLVEGAYTAGQALRLEVDGWPRLAGTVIWCDSGRLGCKFVTPPSVEVFAMMTKSSLYLDRATGN